MLLDIDRHGMDAVRRYSEELDGWTPDRFRLERAELDRAGDAVDEEVRGYLELGMERVRTFAELQLGTVRELKHEVVPGLVVGHRHAPVARVGAYLPAGRPSYD